MATTVLEGTWEELQQHSSLLRGHRLRVSILDAEESEAREENENSIKREPNERMRAAMRKAKAAQNNMQPTDGSQTQAILREGRDGGMFGK
jgi:hypothetical protein